MKSLVMALSSVFAFSVQEAEARNFYKAEFKANVQYTSIQAGTLDLLSEYPIEVRYSDDHDFCWIQIGTDNFECHTYHADDDPERTMITINRGQAADALEKALSDASCDPAKLTVFQRLRGYLDDTIDLEHLGQDFYQEIHDTVPEAFHIWFYEMEQGVKY